MVTDPAMAELEQELAFALELADMADSISMDLFRSRDLVVTTKADLSPVSEADRAIELAMRQHIAAHRPGHAVLGEEFGGEVAASAGWRWVVDPIDGTRSFVRGNEMWGTLIALQLNGLSMVAVVSTPAFGRRYTAIRGAGATQDGEPMGVSRVTSLGESLIAHTSVSGFARAGLSANLLVIAERCWDARGLGNTHSHLAVARGAAEIGWTSRGALWDYAALSLLVEEAGGRFADRSGDSPLGGAGLSSNGLLHDQALALTGVRPVTGECRA